MNLKKILIVSAAVVAGYVVVKQIIKRRNARPDSKLIGYIPNRLSAKITDILKQTNINISWERIGGPQHGIRMRMFDDDGGEVISTTNDQGIMVAGVTFEGRQIIINAMEDDDTLLLVPNPHDKDKTCVEVWRSK